MRERERDLETCYQFDQTKRKPTASVDFRDDPDLLDRTSRPQHSTARDMEFDAGRSGFINRPS